MASTYSFISLESGQTPSKDACRNPFQNLHDGSPSRFDNLVADAMEYWHVPGLAIAVIDGKNITSQGYGVAYLKEDLAKNGNEGRVEKVTPQTLFDCASMSKSFTAAAMALLVQDEERKDVQWQTPVSKLCSDFVFETQFATDSISVEDILSHRTGLPGHDESMRSIYHKDSDTPASITRNLRNLPITRPLRTEEQYNNPLYTASVHLIETLTKTSFAEILSSNFWYPLQMKRTFLGVENVPHTEQPHAAQGYGWLASKSQYRAYPQRPEPEGIGCGSIQSSVEDWARWISAFIHRSPPLSESSYDELSKPRIYSGSEYDCQYLSPSFYALGWCVSYYHGHTIIDHGGLWNGFASSMLYIPSMKWGIVLMGNSEEASQLTVELGQYLIDEVLEVPKDKRFDWRTHITEDVEKWRQEDTKEKVYPELKDRKQEDGPGSVPSLENFVGTYVNKGYHELTLEWNAAEEQLEADWSDRCSPWKIVIKEHAYENWFVANLIETILDLKAGKRCKFDVDEKGHCSKVGIALCYTLDDLVWFERIDESK